MTTEYKRKANDSDIIDLNNVGLSLSTIGKLLGVHLSTVKYRLKVLGIEPVDTRRSFMEDIYEDLTEKQKQWLIEQLGAGYSVKEFVRALLVKEYISRTATTDRS